MPIDGLPWEAFLREVRRLPLGTLWRYAVAGDLPGIDWRVDYAKLSELVEANSGKRGFTYTHKHVNPPNVAAFKAAAEAGFTINLSAFSPDEVEELAATGLPVTTLIHKGRPEVSYTPEGRKIVACPYETRGVSCSRCRLCALPKRDYVIGFYPHGSGRGKSGGKTLNKRLEQLDGDL